MVINSRFLRGLSLAFLLSIATQGSSTECDGLDLKETHRYNSHKITEFVKKLLNSGGGTNSVRTEEKLWTTYDMAFGDFLPKLQRAVKDLKARDKVPEGMRPETQTVFLRGPFDIKTFSSAEISRLAQQLGRTEFDVKLDLLHFQARGIRNKEAPSWGRQTDRLRVVGSIRNDGTGFEPAIITPKVTENVVIEGKRIEPGQWVSFEPKIPLETTSKNPDAGYQRLNPGLKKTLVLNQKSIEAVYDGKLSFKDFLRINQAGYEALSKGYDIRTGNKVKEGSLLKDVYSQELYQAYMRKVYIFFAYGSAPGFAGQRPGTPVFSSKYYRRAFQAYVELHPNTGLRDRIVAEANIKEIAPYQLTKGKIGFQVTMDQKVEFFQSNHVKTFFQQRISSLSHWIKSKLPGFKDLVTTEFKIAIPDARVMDAAVKRPGSTLEKLVAEYYGEAYDAFKLYNIYLHGKHTETMQQLTTVDASFGKANAMYMKGKGAMFRNYMMRDYCSKFPLVCNRLNAEI